MKIQGILILTIIGWTSLVLGNEIKGSLYVSETMRAKELNVQSEHQGKADEVERIGVVSSNISCSICRIGRVELTEKLVVDSISVNYLLAQMEGSSNPGTIFIEGSLEFPEDQDESRSSGTPNAIPTNSEKIQLLEAPSVSVNGVKQWNLIETETFTFTRGQTNESLLNDQWRVEKAVEEQHQKSTSSNVTITSIETQIAVFTSPQLILFGAIKSDASGIAVAFLRQKIYKKFSDLPVHSHVKIEANFFFFSPFWQGETAQINIDGKTQWMDSHNWTETPQTGVQLDVCSFKPSDLSAYVWVYPISFIVNHISSQMEIEVGLTKTIDAIVKCKDRQGNEQAQLDLERIPLFGFDDFSLYVK